MVAQALVLGHSQLLSAVPTGLKLENVVLTQTL